MKFKEHSAIITGGAMGIGAKTAEKFLNEGAKVVLIDINEKTLDETLARLSTYNEKIFTIPADVTDRAAVKHVVKTTLEQWDTIDILINNAGITADTQLLKMTEEDWDRVVDVNLKGVFTMTQQVAEVMKEQQSGVILNASSVVAHYGNFGQTNYAATKAGVIGMTKTWAKELGRYNIRVNAVAPGFIKTAMTDKVPAHILEEMKERSPLKTFGYPEDIANAYAFLASEEARFITGTVLNVDGGVVI